MATPSSKDNGRPRRVLVTLVITTAAAAVTAGVVLEKHQHPEAVAQRPEIRPALARGVAATTAPITTRRQQWRDPWDHPTPPSEVRPTSIRGPLDVLTPSDPSLPSAAEALQRPMGAAGESAPTF